MSAEESERSRLPFEPNKKRQKPVKVQKKPINSNTLETSASRKQPFSKEEMAIPQVVSQRMIRRVAFFCGLPTALGITTLIVSYLLATQTQIKLAPIAVLLANMGLFGLGVLGITYGVLSASWDEERPGGLIGLSEFNINWGRMVAVWRESRQKNV
ncbi:PAM68 family protein [Nostoc sp. LEGE 06077]|uniref:PAM68 family protein n=1 Tax=Nostoc sp. LEGE 06077 TaxID=915325 RepID=UPI00187EA9A9|nr:PAM68 family protein [Nostoc sp. LEGE 06077]MBE9206308.1 PAM68 family protein [Nostoc sp. LEGE 06077]